MKTYHQLSEELNKSSEERKLIVDTSAILQNLGYVVSKISAKESGKFSNAKVISLNIMTSPKLKQSDRWEKKVKMLEKQLKKKGYKKSKVYHSTGFDLVIEVTE